MRLLTENLKDRGARCRTPGDSATSQGTRAREPLGLPPSRVRRPWDSQGGAHSQGHQHLRSPPPPGSAGRGAPPPAPAAPRPPDAVTRAAVAPAALHLLEAVDAALLAAEAAARPVNEVHPGLGIDGEVQEEADHLPVHKDARLSRPCRHRGVGGRGEVWPRRGRAERPGAPRALETRTDRHLESAVSFRGDLRFSATR